MLATNFLLTQVVLYNNYVFVLEGALLVKQRQGKKKFDLFFHRTI